MFNTRKLYLSSGAMPVHKAEGREPIQNPKRHASHGVYKNLCEMRKDMPVPSASFLASLGSAVAAGFVNADAAVTFRLSHAGLREKFKLPDSASIRGHFEASRNFKQWRLNSREWHNAVRELQQKGEIAGDSANHAEKSATLAEKSATPPATEPTNHAEKSAILAEKSATPPAAEPTDQKPPKRRKTGIVPPGRLRAWDD